ncbi:thiamine phosphate synthase [Fructilactobacillus hinvesii]|uniref:Thiamine-phosphate synthase n=1 Tax=Fructilactobacillus hinvesii TaxID=2940300 RepID=A0ABY5BSC8_9LACO|nr:thiamine phosphate synthase [Fructilactobacillus hinvesii]USS88015.1 thiamine phosphate synthase [Fructilactobacillus hinvesii]
MKFNSAMLQVYLVIGTQDVDNQPNRLLDVVKQALAAGVTAVQFRDKDGSRLHEAERVELGRKVHQLTTAANVPLFIDDNVQLTEQVGAEGIHVGQTDANVAPLREQHPDWLIGLSVHNVAELNASAPALPLVDYLGVGPVFATTSKPDAKQPIGVAGVQAVQKQTALPLVAIGGINTTNVSDLQAVPEVGVSVVSALAKSDDITKSVQILKSKGVSHEN